MMTPADVLTRYWPQNQLPIDPTAIAVASGIEVLSFEFEDDPNLSGEYNPAGPNGCPRISYNPWEPEYRQRFTIAHELGHHFLGHGQRFRDTRESLRNGYDYVEVAANRFAADILMPSHYISALINQRKVNSATELAGYFGVSEMAMEFRLRNLGFLS